MEQHERERLRDSIIAAAIAVVLVLWGLSYLWG